MAYWIRASPDAAATEATGITREEGEAKGALQKRIWGIPTAGGGEREIRIKVAWEEAWDRGLLGRVNSCGKFIAVC